MTALLLLLSLHMKNMSHSRHEEINYACKSIARMPDLTPSHWLMADLCLLGNKDELELMYSTVSSIRLGSFRTELPPAWYYRTPHTPVLSSQDV